VTIVNFGKYAGCEEAGKAFGYTKCEDFLEGQKTGVQADPLSIALGAERSTTADSDGEF